MMGKERDLDAAERALGTLPRKREGAQARRNREDWETRLAALLGPVEPVTPPPGMFARISEHLAHVETRRTLDRTRRSARRWQGLALITGVAAAGMAAALLLPVLSPPAETARYVAVVTSDDTGAPGMVVEFDTASGIATVIPVGVEAPGGKAFEMWHLPEGATVPISLGLLPDTPVAQRDIVAGPGDIFAISVEQPDGSPSGQPTDARYHGTIIKVE